MKIFIISIMTIFISISAYSQNVGIGTETPNSSALLDMESTNSGILIPRMTQAQRNAIASPDLGLLIYQTDNTTGFYYYNGSAWIISSLTGGGAPGQITFWTSSSSSTLSGDNALFWDNTNKRLGIGTTTPSETFSVNGAIAIAETSTPSTTTSGYGKLYTKSSDSQLWYKDDNGCDNQLTYDYAFLEERQPCGTAAGTFTNLAWRTRNLNTIVSIKGNSISLNSNTITLAAGTYRITASAPAIRVDLHKTRFCTDAGVTVIVGTTETSPLAGQKFPIRSLIDGIVTVASTSSFLLQHQCQTTEATDGFGMAASIGGEVEIYSKMYIQRLK